MLFIKNKNIIKNTIGDKFNIEVEIIGIQKNKDEVMFTLKPTYSKYSTPIYIDTDLDKIRK